MYYSTTLLYYSAIVTAAAKYYFFQPASQPVRMSNHRMQVRHLLCECGGGRSVGAHAHGLAIF